MEFAWEQPDANRLPPPHPSGIRLSDEVLIRNAELFIRMRWGVAAVLILFQAVATFFAPQLLRAGIAHTGGWPLYTAGVLVAVNLLHWLSLKYRTTEGFLAPAVNIWSQIIVDLVCLTAVVHYLGSIGTPAPFLYVLHIVLAGVFLSAETSFVVVVLVWILYGSCVTLETTGAVPPAGILTAQAALRPQLAVINVLVQTVAVSLLHFGVWYMVAKLSLVIRIREDQLIRADQETRKAEKEKNQYAVQMTHELKSPLDAIRSQISLVINGYDGPVTEPVRETLLKIDTRARGLAQLIVDVLRLSKLNSMEGETPFTKTDMAALLTECVDNIRPSAEKRNISLRFDLVPFEREVAADQIRMLFENLLSNAVNYSHDNGTVAVRVLCEEAAGGCAVSITDQGIGIPADKLPRIFEEYFRTREATEHNRTSSGVGLSIVRRVAQNHGLAVSIQSEPGKGSCFTILFPKPDTEEKNP